MTTERDDDVVATRELPPDPTLAAAVGRHHTLESAVADLVDNSIDAKARRVHIRLLTRDAAVESIRIADDGDGLPEHTTDRAMTYAAKRDYGDGDLGHFGVGMKAASLSQAEQLTVFSRAAGYSPVGRRISVDAPTVVAELASDAAGRVLDGGRMPFPVEHGTVVEWSGLRNVLDTTRREERLRWLDATVERLRTHLGITFHRLVARGDIEITVDEFDLSLNDTGLLRTVTPIDPLAYPAGARGGRSTLLRGEIDGRGFDIRACIWPPQLTGLASFRLFGDPGGVYQGLYAYRRDRLLQIGGWNQLALHTSDLDLVRVSLDVDDVLARHVSNNPEKSGLELDAALRAAVEAAVDTDGDTFGDLLYSARDIRRSSRTRRRSDVVVASPGRGFGADVLEAFEQSTVASPSGPVDVRWRNLAGDAPFEIDLERRTIWLNVRHREIIAPSSEGETTDAAFVKTLLLLLFSEYFDDSYLGAYKKIELEARREVLSAAIDDEIVLRRLKEREEPHA
jgi:hypothetical protein